MSETIYQEIEIDIEILCDACSRPVDSSAKKDSYKRNTIRVEPCASCIQEAKDEGRDEVSR